MKKKTIQRAFAWALTLVMVLSAAPLGVFAEGEEEQKCTCTVKCGEVGNIDCPVCNENAEKCAVTPQKQEDEENKDGGSGTPDVVPPKTGGETPSGGEGGPTGNDTTKSGTTNSGSDSTNTNNSSANSSSTGGGKTSDQTGGSGDGTTTGTGSGSSESKGTPSDKDGEGSGGSGTGENTGNKTEKKTFSISFNVQGHGNKPEDMTTGEDGMLTGGLPALNNVDGFTFVGWYLDKDCSEGKKVENDYPFTANTPLYAKWTENTPTGTGSGSSGSKQDESDKSQNYDEIGSDDTGSISGSTITTKAYKITFNTQGKGNAPQEQYTGEGGKLTGELPTLDNVNGFTFVGWYLDKDCSEGKKVENGDTFTKNTELYAKWTAITYTVVFHRNYSTPNETYTQTFGYNSSDQLGSISRDYYNFVGWAEAPDGNAIYEQTHPVDDLFFGQGTTLDLYAVWRYIPREVTFNACGGTITKDGKEVTSDEVKTQESPLNTVKAEEVPTPTREGYTFLGWYDPETNNKFSLNTPYNTETTLEARWVVLNKPDNVTLGENFLNENSEKLKPGTEKVEIRVEEVKDETHLKLIKIELGGKLDGKNLLAVYDLSVYMIKDNEHQPLTPVKGLIQFDFPVTGNVAAVYHNKDSMPVSDGSKAGYLQNGSTLTIWADSFSPYAIAIDGYQIELDPQGGTLAADVSNPIITKLDGTLKEPLPTPTKTGYTFGGWYLTADCTGNRVTDDAKFETNAKLYAKWTPITYTVVFHDNYRKPEKEETSEQTLTYDKEERLSYDDTKIKREYYQLDGWAETSDGEIVYGTNQQVKNLCSQQGAEKHLYAVWSYQRKTVTFDADGGKIKKDGKEEKQMTVFTQESPINTVKAKEVPVPMTREGYYFGGWYTEKDGKGDLVKPDKTEFTDPRSTVYAYWIEFKPVTVTFKCQGGTARIGSTDVKEFTMQTKWPGVLDGTPTTPSRSSYKFEGWYTAAGVKVDEDTLFLQDATVYARWKRAVSITGNPRTGDQVKLEAAIAILVAAAVGLGATVVLKKRKDK